MNWHEWVNMLQPSQRLRDDLSSKWPFVLQGKNLCSLIALSNITQKTEQYNDHKWHLCLTPITCLLWGFGRKLTELQSHCTVFHTIYQGSFCVCTQPMRDGVTTLHHLSLAGHIHRLIPDIAMKSRGAQIQIWTMKIVHVEKRCPSESSVQFCTLRYGIFYGIKSFCCIFSGLGFSRIDLPSNMNCQKHPLTSLPE